MDRAEPIPQQERIEAMDVLRGFALLGILLVNILFFSGPMQETIMRPWRESPQPWLQGAVTWLVQGKFYCLFSFLFGMGFAVQIARLEARGGQVAGVYARRLAVLLGFGLLHGLLVWMGDILAIYAATGFLLLAFRRRKPRTLLVWAACLLALGILLWLCLWLLVTLVASVPAAAAEFAKAEAAQKAEIARRLAESLQAYGKGPYALLFQVRARELLFNYGMTLMFLPQILAMFLLGAWAGRKGVLRDPEANATLLRRTALWGLPLGLAANAYYAWSLGHAMPGPQNPGGFLGYAVYYLGAPVLSLGYAATLLLALRRPALERLLRPLAAPGRMALSSYLTHSLVFTTLFYFYGLGLFHRLALPWAYALALLLYALQIPASQAWLARFAMGPAEWLWRTFTYGAAPPFRKSP